jgi:hypothetical protein
MPMMSGAMVVAMPPGSPKAWEAWCMLVGLPEDGVLDPDSLWRVFLDRQVCLGAAWKKRHKVPETFWRIGAGSARLKGTWGPFQFVVGSLRVHGGRKTFRCTPRGQVCGRKCFGLAAGDEALGE